MLQLVPPGSPARWRSLLAAAHSPHPSQTVGRHISIATAIEASDAPLQWDLEQKISERTKRMIKFFQDIDWHISSMCLYMCTCMWAYWRSQTSKLIHTQCEESTEQQPTALSALDGDSAVLSCRAQQIFCQGHHHLQPVHRNEWYTSSTIYFFSRKSKNIYFIMYI